MSYVKVKQIKINKDTETATFTGACNNITPIDWYKHTISIDDMCGALCSREAHPQAPRTKADHVIKAHIEARPITCELWDNADARKQWEADLKAKLLAL